MDNELISVIVPVYNIKHEMLKKCIRSICGQTYKKIEIIIIDDGSTDGSAHILDLFANKDRRIHVIHKENGGVSTARNVGLENVNGEYICFVDSDDWLPRNSVEELYHSMKKNNADFCFGTIQYISTIHNFTVDIPKDDCTRKADVINLCNLIWRMDSGPCAKLFKNEIIEKQKLRFPIGVNLGEDTLFLYDYLNCCNIISSIHKIVYYCNNFIQQSLSRGKYNEKLNTVLHGCLEKYESLFSDYLDDSHAQTAIKRRALVSFSFLCKHYTNCLPESKYNLSIIKMQESYEMFKNYLDYNIEIDSEDKNGQAKLHLIGDFLKNNDYDALYKRFRMETDRKQKVSIKYIIKKIYAKLKYIKCFYIER